MRKLFGLLASLLVATSLSAQTGFPPYGSFHQGGFDAINRQNLNVHFAIPIVSSPGRGISLNFAIRYNSLIWKVENDAWTPVTDEAGLPTWGWNKDRLVGNILYDTQVYECEIPDYWIQDYGWVYRYEYANYYHSYRYVDRNGTVYAFPVAFYDWATSCNFGPTEPRTAGTAGFYLDATSEMSPIVFAPDGTRIENSNTPLTDSNGNYISAVFVSSSETHWKDSVGRIALQIKKFADRIEYIYFDTGGTERTVTLRLAPVNIGTNFQCSGGYWGPFEYTGTATLPTSIDLPNGRSYQFTYEQTFGRPGYYTGRLKRVTLPTGGYYEYQYLETPNNGIVCSDQHPAKLTQVVSDGTPSPSSWEFNRVPSGYDPYWGTPMPPWKTVVKPPILPYETVANETVFTFADNGEVSQKIYQGSETGGTLLRTINTTRATDGSPQTTTVILQNDQRSKVASVFDGWGNLWELREYGWGQGAPGPLIRTTTFDYATFGTNNIRPTGNHVYEGDTDGPRKSATTIAYDGAALVDCPPNVPNHDDAGHGCAFTARGNPTSITRYTNPQNLTGPVTSNLTYDTLGNVRSITDPGGHTTSFSYLDNYSNGSNPNSQAYPTQVTYPVTNGVNHVERRQYFYHTGLPAAFCGQNFASASPCANTYGPPQSDYQKYTYDMFGRPLTVIQGDGGQTTVTWNESAPPFSVQSSTKIAASQNLVTTSVFDGLARLKQTQLNSDPQGAVYVDTTYDGLGRTLTVSNAYRSTADPTYGVTKFKYDRLGRVTRVIPPDGNELADTNVLKAEYTGNTTTVTDQAGKKRKSETDALGRLTRVWEPDANQSLVYETVYGYDVLDNLTSVVQSGSRPRTFVYNSLSQLTSATNPESGAISYAYDNDGNLLTKTDARGITVTYSYDELNRLKGKSYSDGTPNTWSIYDHPSPRGHALSNTVGRLSMGWTYDGSGTTQTVSESSYDSVGRITSRWVCTPTNCAAASYPIIAAYDLTGNLTSLTYPSGRVVTHAYNSASQLNQVTFDSFNGTPVNYNYLSASYAPHGGPSSLTLGNGLVETTTYNNRLQPGQMRAASGPEGSGLTAMDYSYNFSDAQGRNNGNVLAINDVLNAGRTQTFSYDQLNRIQTAQSAATSGPHCWGLNFGYDVWGNLLNSNVTKCSAPMLSLSVNANNRITNPGFNYDPAGNLTGDGVSAYVYDAENRLTNAGWGAGVYTYDAEGQRVRKQVGSDSTEYIYFGGQVLAERAANGDWSDYIYAAGRRLAKADSYEDRIHIHGRMCSSCGWQWAHFLFPSAAGLAGYTIRTGDKLYLRQWSYGGARGGITVWFTDGTNTAYNTYDQDGQMCNSDGIYDAWHNRRIDLSAHAGKIVSNFSVLAEGYTAPGLWDIVFADLALVSTDGTVQPIYNGQKTISLTPSYSSGMTEVSYDVQHYSNEVQYPIVTTNYYHGDHLGSSRMMTSYFGYPTWSATYLPFGQEWNPQPTVNHFKFTGHERDGETGLNHTWFRQYDPNQGRWMSVDPLPGSPDDPQSLNRFAYVLNDPVNLTDPLGLWPGDTACSVDGISMSCTEAFALVGIRSSMDLFRIAFEITGWRERWDPPNCPDDNCRLIREPIYGNIGLLRFAGLFDKGDPPGPQDPQQPQPPTPAQERAQRAATCAKAYYGLGTIASRTAIAAAGAPIPKPFVNMPRALGSGIFTTLPSRLSVGMGTVAAGNWVRAAGRVAAPVFWATVAIDAAAIATCTFID